MSVPKIEMYRSDTLAEVGTLANPIDFGLCTAGEDTDLEYQILLYNDKGDVEDSSDAKSIQIQLLKLYVTQEETSDGTGSQAFTLSYIPVLEDTSFEIEVLVDEVEWRKVASFSGLGSTDTGYTFNYTTGVITFGNGSEGKIPTNLADIKITYVPNLNTYGKDIYDNQWISVKSDGVTANEIHIGDTTPEEATKLTDDTVQVLHYPIVTEIVGVWDNDSKTGTNYYTGGSFDADTGVITLGSSMVATTPYVEYKYQIKDDEESVYTSLGDDVTHEFDNPIPKNNAKRLYLRATVPVDASTESGAYLKCVLRILYKH
jgi:hypothetical protein